MGQFLDEAPSGGAPKGKFLDEDQPNAITRGYQAIAKPVTQFASRFFDDVTAPLVNVARQQQGEPISSILTNPAPRTPKGQTNPLAEVAVPQTPLMAGAQLGTLAFPPLAALRGVPVGLQALARAHPALARIFGGALGGEIGGEAQGSTPGIGALFGGGTAGLGEVLGSSTVNRIAPGGKRATNVADTRNVGKALGEVAPDLSGARTVGDLWTMATVPRGQAGSGLGRLGEGKDAAIAQIEQTIGNRSFAVPSISDRPMTIREANNALSQIGEGAFTGHILDPRMKAAEERRLYGVVSEEIKRGLDAAERTFSRSATAAGEQAVTQATRPALPPYSGTTTPGASHGPFVEGRRTSAPPEEMTIETRGLNEYGDPAMTASRTTEFVPRSDLHVTAEQIPTSTGQRMRLGDPTGPNVGPSSAIPPVQTGASQAFGAAQDRYKAGRVILDELFSKAGAYDTSTGMLNMANLQRMLANPRVSSELMHKLGPEKYQTIVDAITRGAGVGAVDLPVAGAGGSFSAIRDLLRHPTGSGQYTRAAIGTVAPNLGARYIGTPPHIGLPPVLQAIVDAALQRGIPSPAPPQ